MNTSNDINFTSKNIISGLPPKIKILNKSIKNEIILYKFVILRIAFYNETKNLIFIGRLEDDLKSDLYNITLNLLYPNITLHCSLRAYSKYVQSNIFCDVNNTIIKDKEIIKENQIVQLIKDKSELLLINKETLMKINFNKMNIIENIKQNLKKRKSINIFENKKLKKIIYLQIYILLIIIIIRIKIYIFKYKNS